VLKLPKSFKKEVPERLSGTFTDKKSTAFHELPSNGKEMLVAYSIVVSQHFSALEAE
jgi:hypothetical protein